jgi:hypothetical protein
MRMHAMSFLTPDEAFLRAAESDPGLELESFLEQVRSGIARGVLRASGFRFHAKRLSTLIMPTPPFELVSCPMVQKFASRERVEIPPLAMADYSGPGYDGRIGRDAGADSDGWEDVRLCADDFEGLWLRDAPNHGERGAYDSGERTKSVLKKCFPIGIPSPQELPNGELVRHIQVKHKEFFGRDAPNRKTILKYAGRISQK